MPLRLPCPSCGAKLTLDEPFPLPGAMRKCVSCGSGLAISYPAGVYDHLRSRRKRFEGDPVPDPAAAPDAIEVPRAPPPPPPSTGDTPTSMPGTEVVATEVAPESWDDEEEFDRTVPSARSPYGDLAANAAEPEAAAPPPRLPSLPPLPTSLPTPANPDLEPTEAPPRPPAPDDLATEVDERETGFAERATGHDEPPTEVDPPSSSPTLRTPEPVDEAPSRPAHYERGKRHLDPFQSDLKSTPVTETTEVSKRKALGCLGGFGSMGCGTAVVVALLGLAGAGGGYWYYSKDLPTVDTLKTYVPNTVTTVHASDGRLLGEIYEERRYVRPLEEIPEHVRNAFLSAEDAEFYEHGGINYLGLLRSIGRGIASGRSPRGTSTITQQVAKNFLLTNERKISRKIKEALLSWRIESTYEKDHILFLYLNEIYLGSQAYGVEAAARTYFGKSIDQVTHGEAALLAGLPPRPSGYSPHKSWSAARSRQEYVIAQMVEKGHLTEAEGKAALAEKITIVPRGNTFLEQAPHFTEHARRFLVERYGEQKVTHEGLKVTTTCDLDLQKIAQEAVTTRIFEVDQRMGFRREALEETVKPADIPKKRKQHEDAMREEQGQLADAAGGRTPLPAKSTLTPGETYKAVITETNKKWVKVGIGVHDAVIPLEWTKWAYQPNPKRSWNYRDATDLTEKYDYDDDRKPDTPILMVGDVVTVKVEAQKIADLDDKEQKAFRGTPGESATELVPARLWQKPLVQGALLSMDVKNGAVRAMVGGPDFRDSQLNRALQSRRQVGSTFKPIVYAAAINTKRITTASMVADAPLAKETGAGFIWKPGNYGNDYLGHITLRQALAMSRNTCTVRILDRADPGMNDDVIYDFARALGIGGTPTYRLPEDHKPSPLNDKLCPWLKEEPHFTICMDAWADKEGNNWCRACDQSMALGSPSISMDEMVRAYSAFPTGGKLIEPYFIEQVTDRNGKELYKHEPVEPPQVMDPAVATITTELMRGVVTGGTAAAANRLGLQGLAGKTGTTNDFKDAWFIGFTNDVITATWVGFDEPASMGVSSTGGKTALPIWMDYMKHAAPKENDRPFPRHGEVVTANIDEETGMQVSSGGRTHLFLPGTVPESSGGAAGQITASEMFDL